MLILIRNKHNGAHTSKRLVTQTLEKWRLTVLLTKKANHSFSDSPPRLACPDRACRSAAVPFRQSSSASAWQTWRSRLAASRSRPGRRRTHLFGVLVFHTLCLGTRSPHGMRSAWGRCLHMARSGARTSRTIECSIPTANHACRTGHPVATCICHPFTLHTIFQKLTD